MNELNILKELLNISGKENISSNIDMVQNLSFLRDGLKKIPMLKGNYKFGKEGRVRVGHNLADELVNKMTEDMFFNRHKDINPKLNINAELGPNRQTNLDLGFNLGQNKGFKLNVGRSF